MTAENSSNANAGNAAPSADGNNVSTCGCGCNCGCGENASVPPASPAAAQPNPMTPDFTEKKELERFLNRGHQTHSTIMLLTFFGVLLFLAAMLYFDTFDYFKSESKGEWVPYTEEILKFDLKNQAQKEYHTFLPRQTAKGACTPAWPQTMYRKIRFDIYLIGGLVFLLGLIAAKIEGAKAHRRELLVLRALLRESEKQRLVIIDLEKKLKAKN